VKNRTSLAILVKIINEKVQIFILASTFSMYTPTNSLLYPLFYLNIIFQRERKKKRRGKEEKGDLSQLFILKHLLEV
jgi:hypothetical protein